MRKLLISLPFAFLLSAGVFADGAKYSVEDTDIGTLLDDPASAEILEKHMPGFTSNDQIGMTRGFTLKAIQSFAPDMVTEDALQGIEADLAKLDESGK